MKIKNPTKNFLLKCLTLFMAFSMIFGTVAMSPLAAQAANSEQSGIATVAEVTPTITMSEPIKIAGSETDYKFGKVTVTGNLSVFSISVDSGSFKLENATGFSYGVKNSSSSDSTAVANTAYTSVQYSGNDAVNAIKSITFSRIAGTTQNVTISGVGITLGENAVYFGGHIYELSESTMTWKEAMEWSLGKDREGENESTYATQGFIPNPIKIESLAENNILVNFYSNGSKNIWLSAVPKDPTGGSITVNENTVTVTGTPKAATNNLAQSNKDGGYYWCWLMDNDTRLPYGADHELLPVWNNVYPDNGGPIYLGWRGAYWDDYSSNEWDNSKKYGVTEWTPNPLLSSLIPSASFTFAVKDDNLADEPTNFNLGTYSGNWTSYVADKTQLLTGKDFPTYASGKISLIKEEASLASAIWTDKMTIADNFSLAAQVTISKTTGGQIADGFSILLASSPYLGTGGGNLGFLSAQLSGWNVTSAYDATAHESAYGAYVNVYGGIEVGAVSGGTKGTSAKLSGSGAGTYYIWMDYNSGTLTVRINNKNDYSGAVKSTVSNVSFSGGQYNLGFTAGNGDSFCGITVDKCVLTPYTEGGADVNTSKALLWTTGWDGASGNNLGYWGEKSMAAVETLLGAADSSIKVDKITDGSGLDGDLTQYDLVWLHLPQLTEANYQSYIGTDTAGLQHYLANGGRIVIQTETSAMMQNYYSGTTKFAQALGAGFSVSGAAAEMSTNIDFNAESKLAEGVSSMTGVSALSFPVLTLEGKAQWVAKKTSPIFADQAVSKGRMTINADINWYMDNLTTAIDVTTENGKQVLQLFKNLLKDTRANMSTVAAGGNPNDGFGSTTLSKEYADLTDGVMSFTDITSSGHRYDVHFYATPTQNAMANGWADTDYPNEETIIKNGATFYKVMVPKVNWSTDYITPQAPGTQNSTSLGVSGMNVVNNGDGSYTYSADLTLKDLVGNASLGGNRANLNSTNKHLWVCLSVCATGETTDNVWYYLGEYTSYNGAAQAQIVTTEAELRAAVANGGEVIIAGDIKLTSALNISKAVTLTSASGTAKITGKLVKVGSNGDLTLKNIVLDAEGDNRPVVEVNGGSLTVEDGAVIQNGGLGIYAHDKAEITLNGGTIQNNSGAYSIPLGGSYTTTAGGIGVISGSTLVMNGGTIQNNGDSGVWGGAINICDAEATINGGIITENSGVGAVFLDDYSNTYSVVNLVGGSIVNNNCPGVMPWQTGAQYVVKIGQAGVTPENPLIVDGNMSGTTEKNVVNPGNVQYMYGDLAEGSKVGITLNTEKATTVIAPGNYANFDAEALVNAGIFSYDGDKYTLYPSADNKSIVTKATPKNVTTEAELVAAMKDSEIREIILSGDITLTNAGGFNGFTINKEVKITSAEGQNYTIKRGEGVTGTLFTVNSSGTLTLENVTIDGGAVWVKNSVPIDADHGVTPEVTNSGVVAKATEGGGGQLIAVKGGKLHLGAGAVLQNNDRRPAGSGTGYASCSDEGSAVYLYTNKTNVLTMHKDAVIRNNRVADPNKSTNNGDGAAISMEAGTATIAGTITGNYAPRMGGAIRVFNANCTVAFTDGTTITNNYTAPNQYGAVCLGNNVTVSGKIIIDNNMTGTASSTAYTETNIKYYNGKLVEATDNELSADSSIGFSASKGTVIGTGFEDDDESCFFVDDGKLDVVYDNGSLKLDANAKRTVNTAAELKQAIADGVKEITLGADITMGDSDALTLNYPVTINGNGHSLIRNTWAAMLTVTADVTLNDLTIDGNRSNLTANNPMILVNGNGADLTMNSCTLQNAKNSYEYKDGVSANIAQMGGAVNIVKGTMNAVECEFKNNSTTSANGGGAAVYLGGGATVGAAKATFTDCNIHDNSANGAGVICANWNKNNTDHCDVTINGGRIENNTCSDGALSTAMDVTLTGNVVIDNNMTAASGGVEKNIASGRITLNATGLTEGASVGITPVSTKLNNLATAENASYFVSDDDNYTFKVEGGVLKAELAKRSVSTEAELNKAIADGVKEITLTGNISLTAGITIPAGKDVTINGGGYALERADTYKGTLFSVNGGKLALENITVDGGAIWSAGTPADRTNSGVVATGQLIAVGSGSVTLGDGAVLQNNHRCNNNSGTDDQGSAVYVYGTGSLYMDDGAVIQDCTVAGNDGWGVTGDGAAVSVEGGGEVVISGTITGNYAPRMGGAIRVFQNATADVTIKDAAITGNYANDNMLGAVCLGSNTNVSVSGTVIIDGNYTTSGAPANVGANGGTLTEDEQGLTDGSKISILVTPDANNFSENSVVLKDAEAEDAQYFTTDGDVMGIEYNEQSGALQVISVIDTASRLQYAIDNANNGDTIKLDGDIVGSVTISAGKEITIDLNGHEISHIIDGAATYNEGYAIINNGSLTIINSSDEQGKITGSGKGIVNYAGAALEIKGDSADDIVITGTVHQGIGNEGAGATTTIDGATVIGGYYAICDTSGAGTQNSIQNAHLVSTNYNTSDANGIGYVIGGYANPGGTWDIAPGVTMQNTVEDREDCLINMDGVGKISTTLPLTYSDPVNGVYTVVKAEAEIVLPDGTVLRYASLADAIEKCPDGAEITILGEITITETITVPNNKNITLVGTGKIIGDIPNSAPMFKVEDGASLTVEGNVTLNAQNKGGIIETSGTVTVTGNASLINGKATNGGAISVADGGSVTVDENATLKNNSASGNGGAVYVAEGGSATVSGGTFDTNSATNGGAIYYEAGADDPTISGGTFKGNAASGNGGAVYVGTGLTATVEGGTMTNNGAACGDAIYLNGATLDFDATDSTAGITDNIGLGESSLIHITSATLTHDIFVKFEDVSDYYVEDDPDTATDESKAEAFVKSTADTPVEGNVLKEHFLIVNPGFSSTGDKVDNGLVPAKSSDEHFVWFDASDTGKTQPHIFSDANLAMEAMLEALEKAKETNPDATLKDVVLDGTLFFVQYQNDTDGTTDAVDKTTIVLNDAIVVPDGLDVKFDSLLKHTVWNDDESAKVYTYKTPTTPTVVTRADNYLGELVRVEGDTNEDGNGATLEIENLTLDGGAVWGNGTTDGIQIKDNNGIAGSVTNNNNGVHASAPVIVNGGDLTLGDKATIQNNDNYYGQAGTGFGSQYYGGGIRNEGSGNLTMEDGSTITGCYAREGGAILNINKPGTEGYVANGNPTVTINDGATITGNASQMKGAAIQTIYGGATTNIKGGTIENNFSLGDLGTLAVEEGGVLTVKGGTISAGSATVLGDTDETQNDNAIYIYNKYGDDDYAGAVNKPYIEGNGAADVTITGNPTIEGDVFLDNPCEVYDSETVYAPVIDASGYTGENDLNISLENDREFGNNIVIVGDNNEDKINITLPSSEELKGEYSKQELVTENGVVSYKGYDLNIEQNEAGKITITGTADTDAEKLVITIGGVDKEITVTDGKVNATVDLSDVDGNSMEITKLATAKENGDIITEFTPASPISVNVIKVDKTTGEITVPENITTKYENKNGDLVDFEGGNIPNDIKVDANGNATFTVNGEEITVYVGVRENAPVAPEIRDFDMDSESVRVNAQAGLEYAVVDKDGKIVKSWTKAKEDGAISFDGLTADTEYKIVARTPADTNTLPSEYTDVIDFKTLTEDEAGEKKVFETAVNTLNANHTLENAIAVLDAYNALENSDVKNLDSVQKAVANALAIAKSELKESIFGKVDTAKQGVTDGSIKGKLDAVNTYYASEVDKITDVAIAKAQIALLLAKAEAEIAVVTEYNKLLTDNASTITATQATENALTSAIETVRAVDNIGGVASAQSAAIKTVDTAIAIAVARELFEAYKNGEIIPELGTDFGVTSATQQTAVLDAYTAIANNMAQTITDAIADGTNATTALNEALAEAKVDLYAAATMAGLRDLAAEIESDTAKAAIEKEIAKIAEKTTEGEVDTAKAAVTLAIEKQLAKEELAEIATNYPSKNNADVVTEYNQAIDNATSKDEIELLISKAEAVLYAEVARDTAIQNAKDSGADETDNEQVFTDINSAIDTAITNIGNESDSSKHLDIAKTAEQSANAVVDSYNEDKLTDAYSEILNKADITSADLEKINNALAMIESFPTISKDSAQIADYRDDLLEKKEAAILDSLNSLKENGNTAVNDIVNKYITELDNVNADGNTAEDETVSDALDDILTNATKAVATKKYQQEIAETIGATANAADDATVQQVIEKAIADINAVKFDETKSVEANKEAIDAAKNEAIKAINNARAEQYKTALNTYLGTDADKDNVKAEADNGKTAIANAATTANGNNTLLSADTFKGLVATAELEMDKERAKNTIVSAAGSTPTTAVQDIVDAYNTATSGTIDSQTTKEAVELETARAIAKLELEQARAELTEKIDSNNNGADKNAKIEALNAVINKAITDLDTTASADIADVRDNAVADAKEAVAVIERAYAKTQIDSQVTEILGATAQLSDTAKALIAEIKATIDSNGFGADYTDIVADSRSALTLLKAVEEKKAELIQELEASKKVSDSDKTTSIINDAINKIEDEAFDKTKSLEEQTNTLKGYADKAKTDSAAQRRAEAEAAAAAQERAEKAAAKKEVLDDVIATFGENYKDIPEAVAIINKANTAIEAGSYSQYAGIIENAEKAVDLLGGVEDYKETLTTKVDGIAEANDSTAITDLIAAAKEAIENVVFDETKSLDEHKTALDAAYNAYEERIYAQRIDDYQAKVDGLIGETDADNVKQVADASKDAMDALVKPTEEQLSAILEKAKTDIAVERFKADIADANSSVNKDFDDITASDIPALENVIEVFEKLDDTTKAGLDATVSAPYASYLDELEDRLARAEFEKAKADAIAKVETALNENDGDIVQNVNKAEIDKIVGMTYAQQSGANREAYVQSILTILANAETNGIIATEHAQKQVLVINTATEALNSKIENGNYDDTNKAALDKILADFADKVNSLAPAADEDGHNANIELLNTWLEEAKQAMNGVSEIAPTNLWWLIITLSVVLLGEIVAIVIVVLKKRKATNQVKTYSVAPVALLAATIVPNGAVASCIVLGVLIVAAAAVLGFMLKKSSKETDEEPKN